MQRLAHTQTSDPLGPPTRWTSPATLTAEKAPQVERAHCQAQRRALEIPMLHHHVRTAA